MKRSWYAMMALIAGSAIANPAASQTFNTVLTGAAEVPTAGSPDGTGLATVSLSGTTLTYSIYVKGIGAPTLSHIHQAPAGTPGGVVVNLASAAGFTNGLATGTATITSDLASAIVANPSGFYVNVHTADFPSGALRGQLAAGPTNTVGFSQLDVSAPNSVTYGTALTGAGEAPGNGATSGGGFAVVTISGTTLSYTILTSGLPGLNNAHIHRGTAGVSGPVVVPFNPTFNNGFAAGTLTTTPALATEILANPSGFYVNVHSTEFPAGSARGQVDPGPPQVVYLPTVVKAEGLNGARFVSDLRILNPTGLPATVLMDYYESSPTGLAGPTATTSLAVPPGSQAVVGDVLGMLFSTSGTGALRLTSNQPVVVRSRILNMLAGGGTTSVLVPGVTVREARTAGNLPLLSNASSSDIQAKRGFRTNLGFFNPGPATNITFRAVRNDGTLIASSVVNAASFARVQAAVFNLITAAEADRAQDNFYVTFTSGTPVFVYATTNDNATGSGIYQDAAPAR